MMYYHSKFGFKRFSSSEAMVQIYTLMIFCCCCCDLDFEHSYPIFPLDTLAYDDLPATCVWLQKQIISSEAVVKTIIL